jgi:predicted nucleic acid-binding Zn finger protein
MNEIIEMISKKKEIDPIIREELRKIFGTRGIKALAAIDQQRVKKYLDFFVVTGATSEYVIDEDFCTCGDFLFRGRECWHLLAVRLAIASGSFKRENVWYQDRWKT